MILWIGFLTLIFIFLALDLGVFHKEAHVISAKEASAWTSVWVTISVLFSGAIFLIYRNELIANPDGLTPAGATIKYLTGYFIELSLSLDNIFVIAVIFNFFAIPRIYQHRVLFWGILGAIFFRAIMIFLGVVLIHKFAWMTFVFGLLLLYSAYKMLTSNEAIIDPRKNPVVLFLARFFPITKKIEGNRFFVRRRHILAATPLFVALMVVETSDVMFAIDSIPAILAITTDPFLVFSSNIFAILGLRSMFFLLSSMLNRFQLLQYSLVFILAYVGVKMLLTHYVTFPEWLSLTVIIGALGIGVLLSILRPPKQEAETTPGPVADPHEPAGKPENSSEHQ